MLADMTDFAVGDAENFKRAHLIKRWTTRRKHNNRATPCLVSRQLEQLVILYVFPEPELVLFTPDVEN